MLVLDDQQVERRPVTLLNAFDQREVRGPAPRLLGLVGIHQTPFCRPHTSPKSSPRQSGNEGSERARSLLPSRLILSRKRWSVVLKPYQPRRGDAARPGAVATSRRQAGRAEAAPRRRCPPCLDGA